MQKIMLLFQNLGKILGIYFKKKVFYDIYVFQIFILIGFSFIVCVFLHLLEVIDFSILIESNYTFHEFVEKYDLCIYWKNPLVVLFCIVIFIFKFWKNKSMLFFLPSSCSFFSFFYLIKNKSINLIFVKLSLVLNKNEILNIIAEDLKKKIEDLKNQFLEISNLEIFDLSNIFVNITDVDRSTFFFNNNVSSWFDIFWSKKLETHQVIIEIEEQNIISDDYSWIWNSISLEWTAIVIGVCIVFSIFGLYYVFHSQNDIDNTQNFVNENIKRIKDLDIHINDCKEIISIITLDCDLKDKDVEGLPTDLADYKSKWLEEFYKKNKKIY
jgi:hypothetical protein